MDYNNQKLSPLVKTVAEGTATFRHVSEGFAKHLDYKHTFSTRRHPVDQSGGMMPSGSAMVMDAYFVANERANTFAAKNGGAAAYPLASQVIAMMEWPTLARIHSLRAFATEATTPVGTDANNRNGYFSATPAAAFPAFGITAFDPLDASFTPINLLLAADQATYRGGVNIPIWEAFAFGVNRRPDPLIIAVTPTANVVANSGLVLIAEFVKPHI